MARYAPNDSLNDAENRSGVLNQTSYSLQDTSTLSVDMFEQCDVELLDTSVTELLDDPYRMKLRRNSNYDGFDQSLGDSWIYPANYPMRQYQYTITEAALFKNTLVVLPTGLGKTFIAAVVMYNIYRWYPTGKVIFMAPTRPLVSQQIEACYRIMGIPRSDTAEVTGKQRPHQRSTLWQSKRVFYATPQIVLADLNVPEQMFPAEQVRLVVIDEAHKAKGRYAYADFIKLIAKRNPYFRVLALSATPGRTLEDVAEVIRNLRISHVEVRWDNSIDVLPYVFRKDVRTIVIPLGQTIARLRKELLRLVNPYLQRLLESNVFAHYPGNITPGVLIMRQKFFRENGLHQRHPNHSTIIADFGVCISMYHALDLLVKHGIRTFLNFFDDGAKGQEKYFVAKDRQIKTFLDQLREQYHHRPQISTDADTLTGNDDVDFGHPKYRILEQQLMTFFKESPDSKAIVFCEFRDSVAMIKRMLSNSQPLIRPNCIVGQGGANGVRVAQHVQIDIMRLFRSGTYNTLIATCVAEEGIDVGEVDLIVCFDIAKNPMRFVQRIGRTGRQRVGRVLMLVTEGEEHDTLKQVLASKDKTNQQLARSKDILRILYPHSPRLVPPGIQPGCVKMYMNIPDEQAAVRHTSSGSSDEDSHNTTVKGGGKRKTTRKTRRNEAHEEPLSKRKKPATRTRDVSDFFSPKRNNPTIALDASERDLFAVESPNQRDRDVSHSGNTTIPIDHTIRLGRTDAQVAIDALLQPLVRHYVQLRRHKYLYRQKLLAVQTTFQEPPNNVPTLDDPLDLPDMVPYDIGLADTNQAAEESIEEDKSISNLFESSLCLPEPTSNDTVPWDGPRHWSSNLQRNVLEYFHLQSLEDIFQDDCAGGTELESVVDQTHVSEREILEGTSNTVLASCSNTSRKPIDLGTADMIFQDDIIDECMSKSPPPSAEPLRYQTSPSIFANSRMRVLNLNPTENISKENGQQPCEIDESVKTQPAVCTQLHSWAEEVGMDESIIGRKIGRATIKNRIDSSQESFNDDRSDDESQRFDAIALRLESSISGQVRASNRCKKKSTMGKNKARNIKRPSRDFLQTQAAVSDDDDDDVDEESFETNSLASFITESDDERSQVNMSAVYLQSVRSPLVRGGNFKIPNGLLCNGVQLPAQNKTNTHHSTDDSYEMDEQDTEMCSFIDENIIINSDTELSELEVAERLLQESRRRKRQTRRSKETVPAGKKTQRRIILATSSDSD